MVNSTDVFVIGGGPAGLATAIAARQQGFSVVVADGAQPPIDKPCGEGLLPDGRAALAALGIEVPANDSHPFRGIRFYSGGLSVEGSFPSGSGIGVRRTVLHRLMVQRARDAGVSLLWKTPVTGLHPQGLALGKTVVSARWIVGADGGHSLARRWAGLDRYLHNRTRFAFRRHYRIAPWSDYMELYWGPSCQIYVTPVASNEICVALVSHDQHLRLDAALKTFPEVAHALNGAEPTSLERGAITSTHKLEKVHRNNVALVGDASGAVDSITGEGLSLTFRQAQFLAECFVDGDLERYQKEHRALGRRPAMMARLMLALDWKTSFRQRAMRAFNADPRIFNRMLAMHVGELSPVDFAANGLSLGWQLLTA